MKHIGLFEGIGGFSEAIEQIGGETIAWCEWNEFGKIILSDKYPNAKKHHDITKTDFTIYRGQCDIVTGGFPCQPFSVAGEQRGTDDHRYLWPEMFRAIREIQPRWVVAENVRGLVSWSDGLVFEQVCTDLESEGYEVFPVILPAAGVNAPHKRERIWFVAYSESENRERLSKREKEKFPESGFNGCDGVATNTDSGERCEGWIDKAKPEKADRYTSSRDSWDSWNAWKNFTTQSPVCDGDDGFCTESLRQRIREDSMGALSEKEIDKIFSEAASEWRKESIKAGGNAIVPQVAYQIFKTINQYENDPK